MVVYMHFRCDGACSNNGYPNARAAAAAVSYDQQGRIKGSQTAPVNGRQTNQRAELTAIILALEIAEADYESIPYARHLDLTIESDSTYAINCITNPDWIDNWRRSGWKRPNGRDVDNKDLIVIADQLNQRLNRIGDVRLQYIPRSENADADELCGQYLRSM